MTTFADAGTSGHAANGPTSLDIAREEEASRAVGGAREGVATPEKDDAIRAGMPAARHHKRAGGAIPAPREAVRIGKRTADAAEQQRADVRRKPANKDGLALIALEQSESRVAVYKNLVGEAANAYSEMPPVSRLRLTDPFTLVSHVLVALSFTIWWQFMPKLRVVEMTATGAYAFEPKPIFHLAVFACFLATFVVSLWVHYFSRSQAADSAGIVSKILLGFFAGAATNYLAIAG
jgi:hypothetical protein